MPLFRPRLRPFQSRNPKHNRNGPCQALYGARSTTSNPFDTCFQKENTLSVIIFIQHRSLTLGYNMTSSSSSSQRGVTWLLGASKLRRFSIFVLEVVHVLLLLVVVLLHQARRTSARCSTW